MTIPFKILVIFFCLFIFYIAVRKVFMKIELLFSTWIVLSKGQLNSEWIYEVIVSPKMPARISALKVY